MGNQISEHVVLTISADTLGQARAGFGIMMILSHTATWNERSRTYGSLLDVSADFPAGTPEYLSAQALFSQTPHPDQVMIGRAANKPTQAYLITPGTILAGARYAVNVIGTGVTPTTVSYTPGADLTVTLVANASEQWTVVGHGMVTGDGPYRLSNSGGGLPAGSAVDTDYWIIRISADVFQLATSKANAIALTPLLISTDGTGVHTIRRAQNDVVCAQLKQGLNAVAGANYTVVQVPGAGETDTLTATGTAPGVWFSLEITDYTLLGIKQTHADPGVSADLDAIVNQDTSWYALHTTFNSKAYVLAAAAWIEAQSKLYILSVGETDSINTVVAGSTDTLGALFALTYNRTAGCWYPSPAAMFSAAWMGRVLPDDPGSDNWKGKTLSGIVAVNLTATQRKNLRDRKANCYTTIGNENKTWEGTVAGGSFGFIDTTRGLDWIEDDMSKGVFDALFGPERLPFTDGGIAVVRNAIKTTLKNAFAMGIIDSTYNIQVPKVADVSSANKTIRNLPNVKWNAVLQGSINHVTINGAVTQ